VKDDQVRPTEEGEGASREVVVAPDQDGERLDTFLATALPDRSRSQLQKLIKDGHVRADGQRKQDGKALRASTPVKAGQRFAIELPEPEPATAVAEDLPLSILYEDSDLVVIDKPAGMVVHPAAGHSSGTVVNALLYHVEDLSGVGGELRPGIVHRLDRGTSGVMVAAKNDTAHKELSRQFHDREVEKEYIALVWGLVQAGKRIDAPIGRDPGDRQKMSTRARRSRSAVTRVTWALNLRGVSLIHVAIHTGRTHQIRVHLSAIGHPIVGDQTYGGVHRHVAADVRPVQRLERPFLHAARLVFVHPADGRRMEFESPLPPDLQSVLDDLRARQESAEPGGL
jgi:23S rRNA pseudouridine1911/1915/1917 synthase